MDIHIYYERTNNNPAQRGTNYEGSLPIKVRRYLQVDYLRTIFVSGFVRVFRFSIFDYPPLFDTLSAPLSTARCSEAETFTRFEPPVVSMTP